MNEELYEKLEESARSDAFWLDQRRFEAKMRVRPKRNPHFFENDRACGDVMDGFWRRVRKSEGCWRWTGPTIMEGRFGTIMAWVEGKRVLMSAHRYSYVLHHGPIPEGRIIRQTCGHGLCVNPAHLGLLTARVEPEPVGGV